MKKFYTPTELKGAMVVDSEGYLYGRLGDMEVKDDDVIFEVYEEKEYTTEVVDEELLKERLIEYLKDKKRRIFKKVTMEDLKKDIKVSLGIEEEDIDLNAYVEYAKKVGVEIPYTSTLMKRKYAKGTISYRDIMALIIQQIPSREGTVMDEYKIVLLNRPKQAVYGGIEIRPRPPLIPPERIKGKLVISKQGRILGYVDGISIAPSTIAIRVKMPQLKKKIFNLKMFIKYHEEYEEYKEYLDKLKASFREDMIDIERLNDIIIWMKQKRYPQELIDSIGEFTENIVVEEERIEDVPWNKVVKIGDVVIVEE